ncbi:unnamed protein product [Schistocephalus solidus]|uniref:Uncharacterized protein n=1 Tax=Schistocephalus solidus TaxID=70667 RepID=A0A183TMF3_SCHSO|nr:unnamed protein product [Schistocephalus solidus]
MELDDRTDVVSQVWAYYVNVWLPKVKALAEPQYLQASEHKLQVKELEKSEEHINGLQRPYKRNVTLANLANYGRVNDRFKHGRSIQSKESPIEPSTFSSSSPERDIFYPSSSYSTSSDYLLPDAAAFPLPNSPLSSSKLESHNPTKHETKHEPITGVEVYNSSFKDLTAFTDIMKSQPPLPPKPLPRLRVRKILKPHPDSPSLHHLALFCLSPT